MTEPLPLAGLLARAAELGCRTASTAPQNCLNGSRLSHSGISVHSRRRTPGS